MEEDFIIKATPLFILTSVVEQEKSSVLEVEKLRSQSVGNENNTAERRIIISPSDEKQQDFSFVLDNNNNSKVLQNSIVERLKQSSPKFMRKFQSSLKKDFNLMANKDDDDETSKERKVIAKLSPKLAGKLYHDNNENSKNENLECEKQHEEVSAETGITKGTKNWRKVKTALKKLKDSPRENLKLELPSNDLQIPSANDSSIPISPETEDVDLYKRMKAFLSNDKKSKSGSPKSPRSKGKFNFWPNSNHYDANFLSIPSPHGDELAHSYSIPSSPSSKPKRFPTGFRRRSAPDAVLRKTLEAFNSSKKTMEAKFRAQIQNTVEEKDEKSFQILPNHSDEEIKNNIGRIMKENLENLDEYESENCDQLGRSTSEAIVKYLHSIEKPIDCSQHKFACLVYIGAVRNDGISVAARALCSPGNDRFIVTDYQNNSIHVFAIVLAIPY